MLLTSALHPGDQPHALATLVLGKSSWYPLDRKVYEPSCQTKWRYLCKVIICIIEYNFPVIYVMIACAENVSECKIYLLYIYIFIYLFIYY
jgi:hypothetical protein